MFKNKKGFTLIELLIVIAIIGVLSSVVLANLSQSRNKARLAKAFATMKNINTNAFNCVESGNSLVTPASSGNGGTQICSNDSILLLPNISDTGFVYCGTGCGGWTSGSQTYAFSAYSDSFSGGRKIIVCGMDYNATGWFYSGSPFNLTGEVSCKKDGF